MHIPPLQLHRIVSLQLQDLKEAGSGRSPVYDNICRNRLHMIKINHTEADVIIIIYYRLSHFVLLDFTFDWIDFQLPSTLFRSFYAIEEMTV